MEIVLLQVLDELGGSARPRDIYPRVTAKFPQLTEADLIRKLPSGGNAWTNRIQWVRLNLIQKGELRSPSHGIWEITDEGRQRLREFEKTSSDLTAGDWTSPKPSLEDLFEEYQDAFKKHLLAKLNDLSAEKFEQFARRLLKAYGFLSVNVTELSNDGGIDGHGRLRVGIAEMDVAFQCKRWQGAVGRPEVDRFRGAIQGQFEQGIFFTTSSFTSGAKAASIRKGAVPIILIDGPSIVELMIERGFGVERRPLELYYDRFDSIFEDEVLY